MEFSVIYIFSVTISTSERLGVSLFLLLNGGSNQPNLKQSFNILHMRNVNDTHEYPIWERVQNAAGSLSKENVEDND